MALIVEDGTGLADANAFVEIADVDQFILDNNIADLPESVAWDAASITEQEYAITLATSVLNNFRRFPYVGSKKTYIQATEWPRLGATENYGPSIPDDVVHWRVTDACCGYALLSNSGVVINPVPSPQSDNIKSQKVGDLSQSFFSADEMGFNTITQKAGYPAFGPDAILQPILRDETASGVLGAAQIAGPAFTTRVPPAFEVGMLDRDGGDFVTESED